MVSTQGAGEKADWEKQLSQGRDWGLLPPFRKLGGNTGPETSAAGPQQAAWRRSVGESASPGPTGPPRMGVQWARQEPLPPPTLKGHPLMPAATGQAKLESGRASLGAVWPPFPAAPYSLLPCPGFAPLPGAAGESGLKSPPQELWGPRGLQAGRPLRSVAITHGAVDAQGQQHDEEDHGPDG